jgi:hypothetical protein
MGKRRLIVAALALAAAPALALAEPPPTLFGRALERDGWHVQVSFGWAGGATSGGLLHTMEIGRSFGERGWTLAYDHIFVLSDGFTKPRGGSDMFGGHMLVFKAPLFYRELVAKVAVGLGENVDLQGGFKPFFGVGWAYGLDFHVPLTATSGLTLGALAVHAVTVDVGHQLAFGSFVGYTWF